MVGQDNMLLQRSDRVQCFGGQYEQDAGEDAGWTE